MVQFRSKNSKRKIGLRPGYTPRFYKEPTGEATVPLWQNDGTVAYISEEDMKWMIEHGLMEKPITGSNEASPQS